MKVQKPMEGDKIQLVRVEYEGGKVVELESPDCALFIVVPAKPEDGPQHPVAGLQGSGGEITEMISLVLDFVGERMPKVLEILALQSMKSMVQAMLEDDRGDDKVSDFLKEAFAKDGNVPEA